MKKINIYFLACIIVFIIGIFKWNYYSKKNEEHRAVARSLFINSDTFNLRDKSFHSEFREYKCNEFYNITRRRTYQRKLFFLKLLDTDLETHTFTLKDDNNLGKYHQYEFNLYYNYQRDEQKISQGTYEMEKNKDWQFVSSMSINIDSFRTKINRFSSRQGRCE